MTTNTATIAEEFDRVIGVDTHKATHTAAIVHCNGAHQHTMTVSATPAGFAELFMHVDSEPGTRIWALEGCGSWGRGLYRWLDERGERVVEVERPKRPKRHMGIKDDASDALRCAREAFTVRHAAIPRADGKRDAIAALFAVRKLALSATGDAERQLLSLANIAPEVLAAKVRGLSTLMTVRTCAASRPASYNDPSIRRFALAMQSAAKRALALRAESEMLEKELTAAIREWRPDLLAQDGVGPIVAAVVLSAWSHPGRIRSEGAFAMISGTAPIPASSGQTQRHRLNRQGDRQLNWALHVTAMWRMRSDERTRTYVERRRAEGKTDREIRRCLKRYIAREFFNLLEKPLEQSLDDL